MEQCNNQSNKIEMDEYLLEYLIETLDYMQDSMNWIESILLQHQENIPFAIYDDIERYIYKDPVLNELLKELKLKINYKNMNNREDGNYINGRRKKEDEYF